MPKCPGQDTQFWKPEDIFELLCPVCDTSVEFLKTDPRRTCRQCGYTFRNARFEMGCAQWCSHAKECLGFEPDKTGETTDREPVAEALIAGLKSQLDGDYARIADALLVLQYAQELVRAEGGDPRVVAAAALLRGLGEEEARQAMAQAGLDPETIGQASRIIRRGERDEALEARSVRDAGRLVALAKTVVQEEEGEKAPARVEEPSFETATAREKARELLAGFRPDPLTLPAPMRLKDQYRIAQ